MLSTDGTEQRVPMSQLVPGDRFVVRAGEAIAADGVVEFGESPVDTAMMTGEPVPADVAAGGKVLAGTIVAGGRLVIRATRTGDDTQLAHLITLVERAQATKSAAQRLADRICGVFVPAVLAAAGLTLAGWLLAGSPAEQAFSAALAVLIIACPCALGLATPAALVVACGRGAQLGIFIKGYQALEASRSVDTMLLDKTGTITTGLMTATDVRTAPGPTATCCSGASARWRTPRGIRSPQRSARSPRPRPGRWRALISSWSCRVWARAELSTAWRCSPGVRSCSPTEG